LDKVFDFSSHVGALPDGRLYPYHSGKKIFDAVFLGAACQFPAVHRMETECVLAYTLTLAFFFRQVRSHFRNGSLGFCDLAHKLADWFVVLQADSS
jgi:hypothetical protein